MQEEGSLKATCTNEKFTSIIINCFAGVVSPSVESKGNTAPSILPPQSSVSPKMVGQMMHPSSVDKHGGSVYS
jgi:hypothetical protein